MEQKILQTFVDFKSLDQNQKRDVLWLAKDFSNTPTRKEQKKLKKQIGLLKKGVPLAYVLKNTQFLSFEIFVDRHTLIPRFETELLVDLITQRLKGKIGQNFEILDLCSGSGCIAVALQKILGCKVVALDKSSKCIKKIKQNAKHNNAKLQVIKSDMFKKLEGTFDLVVSNPPYIKTFDINQLDKSVKDFEPHTALDGGVDGLKFYRIIAEEVPKFLKPNGLLALEIGFDQAKDIKELLSKNFKEIEIKQDYAGKDRFIFAKRREK